MLSRRIALLLTAAFGIAACPYLVTAQPEAGKPAAPATEADRRGPLPNYFGKIAVNDEQRAALYKIQDEYEAQIDALQQQIRNLLEERDDKMEALLTPGQKLRLQELRDAAKAKGAKTEPPKTDAPKP